MKEVGCSSCSCKNRESENIFVDAFPREIQRLKLERGGVRLL